MGILDNPKKQLGLDLYSICLKASLSFSKKVLCHDLSTLHLDPPRHLFHFNDKTLKRYLEDAGFRVIKKKTLSWEYDPFGFVQSTLNFICFKRDLLYNFLRSREGRMIKEGSLWDLFASLILSPFLLLISVIVVPLSSSIGKGGVIRYYLRKTDKL